MLKNNFGVIDDFMQLNIFQNFLCVTFGLHLVHQNSTWENHWVTVDKRGKLRGISKGKII